MASTLALTLGEYQAYINKSERKSNIQSILVVIDSDIRSLKSELAVYSVASLAPLPAQLAVLNTLT